MGLPRQQIDASAFHAFGAHLNGRVVGLQRDLQVEVLATSRRVLATASGTVPVFTGTLGSSLRVIPVRRRTLRSRLVVESGVRTGPATSTYAPVVHEGRRPGQRRPPAEVIERWVQLKYRRGDMDLSWTGVDLTSAQGEAQAIRSAAYVIARSIGIRGIEGRPFLLRALLAHERSFNRNVRELVLRWVGRINRRDF